MHMTRAGVEAIKVT